MLRLWRYIACRPALAVVAGLILIAISAPLILLEPSEDGGQGLNPLPPNNSTDLVIDNVVGIVGAVTGVGSLGLGIAGFVSDRRRTKTDDDDDFRNRHGYL
jgi:hypothetical protein